MYSYEDRLRAVQLYIKLEKRVRLTIRPLGYPTKDAFKSWYRAYERSADMPAGYARRRGVRRRRGISRSSTTERMVVASWRRFGHWAIRPGSCCRLGFRDMYVLPPT